jgi:hypothetical protein
LENAAIHRSVPLENSLIDAARSIGISFGD